MPGECLHSFLRRGRAIAAPQERNTNEMILQTRRLTRGNWRKRMWARCCLILQDPLVMYAWEHAFTDAEIRGWIETNQARYQKDGCGYWAAQASETGQVDWHARPFDGGA